MMMYDGRMDGGGNRTGRDQLVREPYVVRTTEGRILGSNECTKIKHFPMP